jgi:hypothetical protein
MSGGMSTVERLRSPVPVADRIIAKRQEEIQDEEIAVRRCCRVAAAGRRCVIAYRACDGCAWNVSTRPALPSS